MDPRVNPYAPGAGTPPPELAGRDAVLADARLAIERNKSGRSARSFMFVGLRGVGKTVLLNEVQPWPRNQGSPGGGWGCHWLRPRRADTTAAA